MSTHRNDLRLLALSVAVSGALLSGSAFAADRFDASGLAANGPVDGFIVTYRDGSTAQRDKTCLLYTSRCV